MGKKTIAEYVENQAILDQLRLLCVHYAQGFGIAMPCPLADLLTETNP
jgi:EAL domain-containing protein (putative c-di-GMP-specific phosphodiesterase class I)